MGISRYKDTNIIINNDIEYKQQFKERYGKRDFIEHFESQELQYPTFREIQNLEFVNHIWQHGDRFYKLASVNYGDPSYWWIIAWFNKKPTEQHVEIGDFIKIPMPLSGILSAYGL